MTGTFLKVQKIIVKNAPTILAVIGAIGAAASVGLAIDGTLKAQEELEKKAREQKGETYYKAKEATHLLSDGYSNREVCDALQVKVVNTDEEAKDYISDLVKIEPLAPIERAKIYAKAYTPAAVMLGASIFCIISGNHISSTRLAQLAGAYILSETTLKEYKDKVENIVGHKKAQDITDELIQDKVLKNPPNDSNTYIPDMGNVPDLSLWYDTTTDRYFYSNIDYIRKAELDAQRMLERNGFVSINDIYGMLGIKEVPLGDDMGWQSDMNSEVILNTGAVLNQKGDPVGTLTMEVRPSSAWLSEV